MKNKKTVIGIIVVIILGIGLYFFNSEKFYTAADVLEDVDFSVEEQSVELTKIVIEVDDGKLVPIELTDTTQKKLIKTFEKSKFKKDESLSSDNDYSMKITLNRGYFMFMDITGKSIAVRDNSGGSYEEYLFEDDKGFFSILEELVRE